MRITIRRARFAVRSSGVWSAGFGATNRLVLVVVLEVAVVWGNPAQPRLGPSI